MHTEEEFYEYQDDLKSLNSVISKIENEQYHVSWWIEGREKNRLDRHYFIF